MSIDRYDEIKRRLESMMEKGAAAGLTYIMHFGVKQAIAEVDALEPTNTNPVVKHMRCAITGPCCYPDKDCSECVEYRNVNDEPAPAVDEVCECGHSKDMHYRKHGDGPCVCSKCDEFTPRQPAPSMQEAERNANSIAELVRRVEKLEQAAGDFTILRDRIDEIDRELEQAAGGEELLHIIGAIIYDLGNINGQRSNLTSCEMWDAFIAREKARQGK